MVSTASLPLVGASIDPSTAMSRPSASRTPCTDDVVPRSCLSSASSTPSSPLPSEPACPITVAARLRFG